MSQLKLKNVATAKHSLAGMSCVNFNSYTYNDLPHTARGIPLSEGAVGSILPFVGQLSLVAWTRVKNGREMSKTKNISSGYTEPVDSVGAPTEHFLYPSKRHSRGSAHTVCNGINVHCLQEVNS